MAKQNILERIEKGSIETNFDQFPETVNGFTRDDVFVDDDTVKANFNYAGYTRGNALGYVTAKDLAAGKPQVRKMDQARPEGAGRKVAVPSERIY